MSNHHSSSLPSVVASVAVAVSLDNRSLANTVPAGDNSANGVTSSVPSAVVVVAEPVVKPNAADHEYPASLAPCKHYFFNQPAECCWDVYFLCDSVFYQFEVCSCLILSG
jgi:hypothetical protein